MEETTTLAGVRLFSRPIFPVKHVDVQKRNALTLENEFSSCFSEFSKNSEDSFNLVTK